MYLAVCSIRPCCSFWTQIVRPLSSLPKPKPTVFPTLDKPKSNDAKDGSQSPFVFFRPKEILYETTKNRDCPDRKFRVASLEGIVEIDDFMTPVPKYDKPQRSSKIEILGVDQGKFMLEQSLGIEHGEPKVWEPIVLTNKEKLEAYMTLSKIRLTGLVVLTSVGGFVMAPAAIHVPTMIACCIGTGLLSMTANSINHFLEAPFDAQMKRTQNRPLVTRKLSPLNAVTFASVTFGLGCGLLLMTAHPLTAALGVTNVLLYTAVYTPMKRSSIACTWVGSVVGSIPPLMGWVANVGPEALPAAAVLAAILFAWQFPHFNGLSWNLRQDYSRAGYRVMCVTNPTLCTRTSLRYSMCLLGLCSVAAPMTGLTTWFFAIDTVPFNLYLIYLAYNFHANPDSATSRKLFRYSLVYLPAIILFMMIGKDWDAIKS